MNVSHKSTTIPTIDHGTMDVWSAHEPGAIAHVPMIFIEATADDVDTEPIVLRLDVREASQLVAALMEQIAHNWNIGIR